MDFNFDKPKLLMCWNFVCTEQMKKAAVCLSLCPASHNFNTEWLYFVGKYFSKIYFDIYDTFSSVQIAFW